MGKRDYRHRESKKPKKDRKKPLPVESIITSASEPKLVRKDRLPKEES